MPSFTSVRSGYWSDPSTWDLNAVPANGDTVTIASGHTVIFDVDQSSFTNGLAGLTINGTLKIPSQQEDSNMPNFVCLKVNANIAGTGSFIIGSSTYPITSPQTVAIYINGTLTTATVQVYGDPRIPCWDYLANNAPAGSNTIVLTNGMPLLPNDTIIIGAHLFVVSTDRIFTVQSYDASTKTVTLDRTLANAREGGPKVGCLVILVTRFVKFYKYGTNNVRLITGSGRFLQGIEFIQVSGATSPGMTSCTSSTYISCYASQPIVYGVLCSGGQNNTFRWCSGYYTYAVINVNGGTNVFENCAAAFLYSMDSSLIDISDSVTLSVNNCFVLVGVVFRINADNKTVTIDCQNLRCGASDYSLFSGSSGALLSFKAENLHFQGRGTLIGSSPARTLCYIKNLQIYATQTGDMVIAGLGANGLIIIDGVYAERVGTPIPYYGSLGYCVGNSTGLIVRNMTTVNMKDTLGSGGKFVNLNVGMIGEGGFAPAIRFPTEIKNLQIPSYQRPTVVATSSPERVFRFVDVEKVNNLPVRERIWCYGYVKNRWDATPPNYSTFDFYLTDITNAAPLYLDFRSFGASTISVLGTISQLGLDEEVKVQIFSSDKEPLLGDVPDFEQTYSQTGSITISWTPPDAKEWIVRIVALMNQTQNPVTIEGLNVGGGEFVSVEINEETSMVIQETNFVGLNVYETLEFEEE